MRIRRQYSGHSIHRRHFIQRASAVSLVAAANVLPPWARPVAAVIEQSASSSVDKVTGQRIIDIVIDEFPLLIDGRIGTAIAMNGTVPGPLIRLREGDTAILRVTNRLREITSIHWHGLLVPADMDGVPGVSFGGIRPGETFIYRFPVRQSGTYWCHSHSGGQELLGLYAPLIIDPIESEPFRYDREHVVMLSDWSFEHPEKILDNLKKRAGYYNFQRRTVGDFLRGARRDGWRSTVGERLSWARMRMDPTDFADVTAYTYTYLLNGLSPEANWTGLFNIGENVRLRIINAGAMTYFDVRIPGLAMTVVQADGQNVRPVEVGEFRIAPAETFDVLVRPTENRAYTLFAESLDRGGYARGTLSPRPGLSAPIPPRRMRPLRTMTDMGMSMQAEDGMSMPGPGSGAHDNMIMPGTDAPTKEIPHRLPQTESQGTAAPCPSAAGLHGPSLPGCPPMRHGADTHGAGNSSIPTMVRGRLEDPGSGLGTDGWRVLVYTDLQSVMPQPDQREPAREIELHLTGNMDRYMWSFDGKKYSEAKEPIAFRYGERLRLILVNDTMMEHPIHLHGMWMELENGTGAHQPRKHTVNVKPAERLTVAITADEPGRWAMHCHLLLHMEAGMFRVVEVSPVRHAPKA